MDKLLVDARVASELLALGFPQPHQGYKGEICENIFGMYISRPTVKETVDYLRDKYDVFISTVKNDFGWCWRFHNIDQKTKVQSFTFGIRKKKACKSEDEALLKAINYFFRIVEI